MSRMRRLADHAGRSATVLLTAGWLAACSGGTPPILDCAAGDGFEPDCRFRNPEDLVASPAGGFILVSQFGDMEGHRPGSLVALDPASGDIRPLYPQPRNEAPTPGWGNPDCGPPDASRFAPHGIDLKRLDSGADALYVVNHGGRESVEMFEVREDDHTLELVWQGCVLAPDDGYFNDVVVLSNGDFRVSQMFPRGANVLWTALRSSPDTPPATPSTGARRADSSTSRGPMPSSPMASRSHRTSASCTLRKLRTTPFASA